MARAKLTIDLGAIADNWRALDSLSAQDVETGAVVKADAYGLGIDRVAPALARAGARSFFVAQTSEGAALRKVLGPGPRIFVFEGLTRGEAPTMRAADLVPLLNSTAQIAERAAQAPDLAYGLQIDTGMHRLGIPPEELASLPATEPQLIISHLASADTPDAPQNAVQAQRFTERCAHWPDVPCSLAATGGILMGHTFHHALTRPGIGLYGGQPFNQARPVVRLSLPVIQARHVPAGEHVGYGAAWTAPCDSRVATLSSGYADGLIRAIGNRATLYHRTTPVPLIGRVSMDLITADITTLTDIPDSLDILGPAQGVDALAAAADTIGYEILTALGTRYQRVYTDGA